MVLSLENQWSKPRRKRRFYARYCGFTNHLETDSLYVSYEGIPYLNYVHVDAKCDLELDMLKSLYAFKQTDFLSEKVYMPIMFDGVIGLPNDIDMTHEALKIWSEESDFLKRLSLIPAVYAKDFAGLKASGKFAKRFGEADLQR